nr:PREDICTED: uncharacterized protein LOC106491963 [Apteryx mantelli mantelli]
MTQVRFTALLVRAAGRAFLHRSQTGCAKQPGRAAPRPQLLQTRVSEGWRWAGPCCREPLRPQPVSRSAAPFPPSVQLHCSREAPGERLDRGPCGACSPVRGEAGTPPLLCPGPSLARSPHGGAGVARLLRKLISSAEQRRVGELAPRVAPAPSKGVIPTPSETWEQPGTPAGSSRGLCGGRVSGSGSVRVPWGLRREPLRGRASPR